MKHLMILPIWFLLLAAGVPAAPTVSNVAATITSRTDNGKGMITRTFEVTFNLANTNGKACRIWPGVRGVEKTPVLTDEGPWLWWKNLSGDTAASAGNNKRITFQVADTAGEFTNIRVRVTAWDRDGWPPYPNRPFNPRHHVWSQDIRRAPVQANSAVFLSTLKSQHTAWGLWQDHPVFTVMGNHSKQLVPTVSGESDGKTQPLPHVSLGDPEDAYTESGTDRHIEMLDVENWINYGGWLFEETGAGYPNDWRCNNTYLFPLYSETFVYKGATAIPNSPPSIVGTYRPMGWTSGSAGGLDIVAGLIRLQDVADGEIQTALRFTTTNTAGYYVHPASHLAGTTSGAGDPPNGLRLRLKQSININQILPDNGTKDCKAMRMVLRAWQKYGYINDDNGAGTSTMAEKDDHTELKWSNLMSSSAIASQQYNFVGRGLLDLTTDFEVVDWNWQYTQYDNYDKKR